MPIEFTRKVLCRSCEELHARGISALVCLDCGPWARSRVVDALEGQPLTHHELVTETGLEAKVIYGVICELLTESVILPYLGRYELQRRAG